MDKYEPVREIGAGNFGVAKLMRNKETCELVAMKFIERGNRVSLSETLSSSSNNTVVASFLLLLQLQVCDSAILQDRRECFPRDREPPFAASPEHHPFQGGGADADAPGDRDGVRGRRGAVRAHLRGRPFPRGRSPLLLPAAGVRCELLPRHADLPPRPQAREHTARRQPRAATQDLRLRIFQVVGAALATQVNGRHAGVHRPGGALPPRVRRQARRRLVLRRHPLRHARRRIPIRGSKGPKELPKDNLADHVRAVQDSRVRARLPKLPPPPLPHLRRKPFQEDHHERDQEPPLVPQEPAAGAQGGGPGRLLQPPRRSRPPLLQRRRHQQCQCQWRGVLGAERGGDHADRAGGADGAQASQARLRLWLGRLGRRPRPAGAIRRGGGRGRLRQDGAAGPRQRGVRHEQAPNLTLPSSPPPPPN